MVTPAPRKPPMLTTLLLCLAVLCWPATPATARLRVIAPARTRRRHRPRPGLVTITGAAAATGWLVAGPAGGAAGALLTITGDRHWQARTTHRRALATTDAIAEAIRGLVTGLRSGAHPAEAADAAATDAHPCAAAPLRAIAAATRLDGDLDRTLSATAPAARPALRGVVRAWQLAQRHGLPLADVLEATARDLAQRARFTRRLHARLAGPRASATVLATLPPIGVALGEAMGAGPVRVLTTTVPGQVLLLIGTVLLCAGITWSAHLTAG